MRISFLISSLTSGGAERVVSVLANKFCEEGHSVQVVVFGSSDVRYVLHEDVCYVDVSKAAQAASGLRRPLVRLSEVCKAINSFGSECVLSFMTTANIYVCLLKPFLNAKIVVSERNDPKLDPKQMSKRFLRSFLYRFADGFVFQTEEAQAYFRKNIVRKSTVIVNPVKEGLPPWEPKADVIRFVAMGRLAEQKNYKMMIDAFELFHAERPDSFLDIFGNGPEEENLSLYVDAKGLSSCVALRGFCGEVHDKLSHATGYLLSSDYEGMPNSLIEALCMGVPSISTDCPCGGPRVILRDGKSGLLVPVGDSQAMANAMKRVAFDRDFSNYLSTNCKMDAMRFELDAVYLEWIEFVRGIK